MKQGPVKLSLLAILTTFTACTNLEENVIFVTATEIDIGYDAQIGNLNIGYDRNEFVAGPQYVDTGGTPPVAASIQSNLSVFSPKINQVYATGNAARIATGGKGVKPDPKVGEADNLSGKRRAMFFGTGTSFGLNAKMIDGAPSAVTLGYKRKEISIIPLRKSADRKAGDKDKYGSVLASIELGGTVSNAAGTGIQLGQFFATGSAAEALANNETIKNSFAGLAETAAKNAAYLAGVQFANKLATDIGIINNCIQTANVPFDTLATRRLNALVASAGITGDDADDLNSAISKQDLSGILKGGQNRSIPPMLVAAESPGASCDS